MYCTVRTVSATSSGIFLNIPCSVYSLICFLLAPSGVLFSQLLTEHKNLTAAVAAAAVAVLQTEALIDSVPE
jgi:hypothetical protein